MKSFSLAVSLALCGVVLAAPPNSGALSQIPDGQVKNLPSGSSSSSSSSTSSSSNITNNSLQSQSTKSGNDDSAYSAFYVSPESNMNAKIINQIPDGQVQSGSGSGSTGPMSLAGSENLNTYSHEPGSLPLGGLSTYNIQSGGRPLQQIPDGQIQNPGTTSTGLTTKQSPMDVTTAATGAVPEIMGNSQLIGVEATSEPEPKPKLATYTGSAPSVVNSVAQGVLGGLMVAVIGWFFD